MEFQAKYITEDIKLSCYADKFSKSDIVFGHHMLIWFISGETKIVHAEGTETFGKGDIFLIPKNQLATVLNYPGEGRPHQTVVMHLTTEWLQKFYSQIETKPLIAGKPTIRRYGNHPLLESCLASLIPYFGLKDLPKDIANLKLTEAITVLRSIDPGIDNILGNFELPGKIPLADYMEKNFVFNMPLEKFGYLTGRSLTTFKRDFKKAFDTTPQRWLTKKRLDLAHYQFLQKKKKPIDVCYEVGFEDLSHFSFAFKKQFGYTPTQLLGSTKQHISGEK
jgi:AraC family transcriptional regulator, exoenzyme S synthesis regulatory protein ExsA